MGSAQGPSSSFTLCFTCSFCCIQTIALFNLLKTLKPPPPIFSANRGKTLSHLSQGHKPLDGPWPRHPASSSKAVLCPAEAAPTLLQTVLLRLEARPVRPSLCLSLNFLVHTSLIINVGSKVLKLRPDRAKQCLSGG